MKITNWKSIGKNTLRGSFDLEMPSGMFLYGMLLMKNEQSTWVAFPGIPTGEKDGKKTFKPVVQIPSRNTRDKFNEQVIAALKSLGHV